MDAKICSECGREFPADSKHFAPDKRKRDGFVTDCRECRRQSYALYRATHREKEKERHALYRANHREELRIKGLAYDTAHREEKRSRGRDHYAKHHEEELAKQAAYRRDRPEAFLAAAARFRAAHREQMREKGREYYAAHRAEAAARHREYAKLHPDRMCVIQHNRRARLLAAPGTHTAADITAQYERQRGRCYWCGAGVSTRKKHVDHVMPLVLGGSNGPENLVIACPSCNHRKQAKHPMDWAGRLC
ncbi:MAG: HNH endonuclease [Candidatus Limnocylindrales bacterium]|jgi:5-methylcytosine-specific restriction endonuclease McrA